MKNAAQLRVVNAAAQSPSARVIDIRTGRPWRPSSLAPRSPVAMPAWRFLWDMVVIFAMGGLGAWLFIKMQGG